MSVRDIVQVAGVNLAAVSYYFGSKSELLLAVFRARAKELNRERLALLRGDSVLVAGQGPIGLMFTRLLALRGMRVWGRMRECGNVAQLPP